MAVSYDFGFCATPRFGSGAAGLGGKEFGDIPGTAGEDFSSAEFIFGGRCFADVIFVAAEVHTTGTGFVGFAMREDDAFTELGFGGSGDGIDD